MKSYTVVGHAAARKDALEKVTGKAKYAGDFAPPGLLQARIVKPPAWDSATATIAPNARGGRSRNSATAGARPKVSYGQEYNTEYDFATTIEAPRDGEASIEAICTAKGDSFYAILPRWPGRHFALAGAKLKSVALLGPACRTYRATGPPSPPVCSISAADSPS